MKGKRSLRARLSALYQNRNEPEGARALAHVLWELLCIFSVIVIILVALYGALLFIQVSADVIPESDASVSVPAITKSKLEETLWEFEVRKTKYESLRTKPAL